MYFCGIILNKNNVMNLKLLLGTLMLTAVTANAQVATINENFNNFTAGNTTFPQGGWSAVLPPMNMPPSPPPPMMIVYETAGNASDKYVSSYSGGNKDTPQYLVSPQIVAPTGDKTLSFKTRLNSSNTAQVTLQVGLASSPTDMTTFVAVGDPIIITQQTTFQTFTRVIPSSSSSYIVFKTVNTVAGAQHTAADFDDVVYDFTSVLGTSDVLKSSTKTQFAITSDNTALQFVTKKDPKNVQVYSALGQKVADGKLNNQRLDISELQSGVYFVLIEEADGTATKSKFIKK